MSGYALGVSFVFGIGAMLSGASMVFEIEDLRRPSALRSLGVGSLLLLVGTAILIAISFVPVTIR